MDTPVTLFVYGTLMDDALVRQLTGRTLRTLPAVLSGYRRITAGAPYPYIVPSPDETVNGIILCDVDAETLRVFDQYEDEGRLYRRIAVTVSVEGTPRAAMAYVGIPEAVLP